jgi:hypothetical protein
MSTRLDPMPQRPLLDPAAFEAAGRQFREWLDRLLGHREPEADTSIAWESGEPDDETGPAH